MLKMDDNKTKAPSALHWISLGEAFQKIGRNRFGAKWERDCWKVGRYSPQEGEPYYVSQAELQDAEADAFDEYGWQLDSSPKEGEVIDFMGDDVILASQKWQNQFNEIDNLLRLRLWHGDITTSFINPSGELDKDVTRSVWRGQKSDFNVYWADSRLLKIEPTGGAEKAWDVEVKLSDIKMLLKELEEQRKKAVRKEASQKNSNTGGRPPKYNWKYIDSLISDYLKKAEDNVSNNTIAKKVITHLEKENIEEPVESAMRGRVARVRNAKD